MTDRLALQHAAQPHVASSRPSACPSYLTIPAVRAGQVWSNVDFDATTMGHKPASPRRQVSLS